MTIRKPDGSVFGGLLYIHVNNMRVKINLYPSARPPNIAL
jgi:hypothetical protein